MSIAAGGMNPFIPGNKEGQRPYSDYKSSWSSLKPQVTTPIQNTLPVTMLSPHGAPLHIFVQQNTEPWKLDIRYTVGNA